MPGRLTATIVTGFLLLGGGTLSTSVSAKPGFCARKGSVTIKANGHIRVYRDRHGLGGASIVACDRVSNTKARIGTPLADTVLVFGGPRSLALRGSTVAYGLIVDPLQEEGGGPVAELHRMKAPFTSRSTSVSVSLSPSASTRALVSQKTLIARNGTVVIAACTAKESTTPYKGCESGASVRIVAATSQAFSGVGPGARSVWLAKARRIDPQSLRLSPSETHVGWTEGGHHKSARLPSD